MSEVDIGAYSQSMATALSGVRSEFESKINALQNIVESIGWYSGVPNLFAEEIGDVTFSSLEGAKQLVEGIEFVPIESRELYDATGEQYKTHVFESDSLEVAENKILEVLANAGQGELVELSACLLSTELQDVFTSGQEGQDAAELNVHKSLLSLYPTPDTQGNSSWIDTVYSYKRNDRQKEIYIALFDMAQESSKWLGKTAIEIEKAHADFTAKYSSLVYSLTQANIAAYKADVSANIAELEANIKQVDTELGIEALKLDRESAEWGLKIQQANSRLGEYSKNYAAVVSSNLQMLNARIAGGKNVADAYKAIFGSYSSQYTGVSMQGGTV